MIIKFKLQGVERIIRQNGANDFTAFKPGTDRALGYYNTLPSAVLRHIRDAAILDTDGSEEVIDLKIYIERHKSLFNEILGLSIEDISKFAVFQEVPSKMTEERKAKIKATKAKKKAEKELEHNIPTEEDEDDGL